MLLLDATTHVPAVCPRCGSGHPAPLALTQVRFRGAVTLVETHCPACGTAFGQTLPNGQFNRFPVSVSTDGQHLHVSERGRWLASRVRAGQESPAGPNTSLVFGGQAAIHVPNGAAISLLLCLDTCYGHALMMLFNAERHQQQHPERPLIVVVPAALAWLVPDYVAETWVIDRPLSVLDRPIPGFDLALKAQLARFGAVWFSTARIHFDHRTTRFSDFTRTPKFDLNQFDTSGPRLTFVLREDRLWLRHGWERWLHKVLIKCGLGTRTRPLWARWQAARYRTLQARLRQQGLVVQTVAVGLTGGQFRPELGPGIRDDRQPAPISPEQERTWCAQYAQSHLVVGVHGSGMLLPTSLAAGFICLLPPDKLAHYAEDILLAHENPIHQSLLGRFLPTSASPRQLADHIVSMLTELPVWLAEARERS